MARWWISRKIRNVEIAALLPDVWSAAEYPSRSLRMIDWILLFRIAAYPKPDKPVRIYGAAPPRYARGMAWTTDVEQARRFVDRWRNRPGFVYTVVAGPDAVLCDIDAQSPDGGRNEHEIVVDPGRLGPIERLR